MKRIKFHLVHDMMSGMHTKRIINFVNEFTGEVSKRGINDILEGFNVLKFWNIDRMKKIIENETNGSANRVIGNIHKDINTFISKEKNNFLEKYLEVEIVYRNDFWELVSKHKIYKDVDEEKFQELLTGLGHRYIDILGQNDIVEYYSKIIVSHMINDVHSAEFILDKYEVRSIVGTKKRIYLPECLTDIDLNEIMSKYIESESCNANYVSLIINSRSQKGFVISNKVKLKAIKRYDELTKKLFLNNSGIKTEIRVVFNEKQYQKVKYVYDNNKYECSVSTQVIEENLDNVGVLNNIVELFNYFDQQYRLTLVSKMSDVGVFERLLLMRSKNDYSLSNAFHVNDGMSKLQFAGYLEVLRKNDVCYEDVLGWYFNNYVEETCNVKNMSINMPTQTASNLEKCRILLPELESILKQYNLFIEDGKVDQELLQMSSNSIRYSDVKSSVDKKYVYPNLDLLNRVLHLFFSDQSDLIYIPAFGEGYESFYELIWTENIKMENFKGCQIDKVEWLLKEGYLTKNDDGCIKIQNQIQLMFLKDLFINEVVNYWRCRPQTRKEIDILIHEKKVYVESTLFSKMESDYFDYHLNNSKFGNAVALRNDYLHGSQKIDESRQIKDYLTILKLLTIIAIKINDDLVLQEIEKKNITKIL